MLFDGAIHQPLDLLPVGHVCLDNGVAVQRQVLGKSVEAINASGAQNELCTVLCQPARRRFSEPAARAGSDDDLVFDTL